MKLNISKIVNPIGAEGRSGGPKFLEFIIINFQKIKKIGFSTVFWVDLAAEKLMITFTLVRLMGNRQKFSEGGS